MLTLATRPHGDGTQTRTAAPTQPLPPAETTADPSTATPARRVAEALDKAVEGLEAAFENFERDVRARGMRPQANCAPQSTTTAPFSRFSNCRAQRISNSYLFRIGKVVRDVNPS